jgi:hypothetical protein
MFDHFACENQIKALVFKWQRISVEVAILGVNAAIAGNLNMRTVYINTRTLPSLALPVCSPVSRGASDIEHAANGE